MAPCTPLTHVPRAFSTRRVPRERMRYLRTDLSPRSGDLLLARVAQLGQHFRLHLPNGRRRQLYPGDEIIVSYAARYAPSQYEALVPSDLAPCHLVAGGGIAALVVSGNSKLSRRPTELLPLGLIAGEPDGPALNLASHALPEPPPLPRTLTTIAVVGSSMDSGKTTALAQLTHSLRRLGLRVGYAKLTGTAAGGDPWLLRDAGADPVLDFTDAGHASTSRVQIEELERVADFLVRHLQAEGADVALLEVADGLFQPETAALVESARFAALIDGVVYAAVDALGAAHGADLLNGLGYRLLGLAGMVSTAPLLAREAQSATNLPVFSRRELGDASVAARLLAEAGEGALHPCAAAPGAGASDDAGTWSGRSGVVRRRTAGAAPLDYLAYVPADVRPDASLLVAVHGYSRDACEQIELFAPLCERAGVVLAAPCFDQAQFPNYQRFGRDGETRSDQVLDEMVQDLRRSLGMLLGQVSLFGYSGGGQFTHRYAMAHPHRVARAVVAAPGWYTFPDRERPYPYGTRVGSRLSGVRMDPNAYLSVPMLVVVGELDDDPNGENLRRETRLDRQQGCSRLERAVRWVDAMQKAALELGYAPRVRLETLAGAGHSFAECMAAGLGNRVVEHLRMPVASAPDEGKPVVHAFSERRFEAGEEF